MKPAKSLDAEGPSREDSVNLLQIYCPLDRLEIVTTGPVALVPATMAGGASQVNNALPPMAISKVAPTANVLAILLISAVSMVAAKALVLHVLR